MIMLLALNILNKNVKDDEERTILKQFRDYLIEIDFDVKNEDIGSSKSIIAFTNFCDKWISDELIKDEIRDFSKCLILINIFFYLGSYVNDFEEKIYICKIKRDYLRAYHDVVVNITSSDSSYFISKVDETDDNFNELDLEDNDIDEINGLGF